MRRFNITIARRLWLLVSVALVAMIAIGATGLSVSRGLALKLAEVNGSTLPRVKTLWQCLLVFNVPFTLLKGLVDVLITFLIYKKLSPILHK